MNKIYQSINHKVRVRSHDELEVRKYEFLEICDKFTNKEIFKVDEFGKIIRDSDGEVIKLKFDND